MLQTSIRVLALVALSAFIAIPNAVARGGGGGHGGHAGGGHFSGGRSFSGGHSFSGARSYSAPRSYSVTRSYSAPRSYSPSRSYSAPRHQAASVRHSAPQVARVNAGAQHATRAQSVPQARNAVAHHDRQIAGIQGNAVRTGSLAGRNTFRVAHAMAAVRPLGGHALHNRFVAGRLGVAGVHGRTFAQATTFRGHFPHRFWNRHHLPRWTVIGWAGPLFWPYAYDDFVGYTFYPYAYDTFWPYAYDDVYDGIFGRYAYGSAAVRATGGEPLRATGSELVRATAVTASGRARTDLCAGETAPNLTNWPMEQIAQTVDPTDAQRAALEELREATGKAVEVLKSACPNDLPSTPTGRLAAMQKRLAVMLLAVRTVRPALDTFYQSLNDEQKARFNAISPAEAARPNELDLTQACGERASGITSLPMDRIEQTVRPNEIQRVALNGVRDAMAESTNMLKSDCPTDRALTPTGRVEAMEQRLDAMSRAVRTLEPALDRFYGTLSDEQKERFNRLGPAQS